MVREKKMLVQDKKYAWGIYIGSIFIDTNKKKKKMKHGKNLQTNPDGILKKGKQIFSIGI